tara:strand:- start:270 stop:932 length:663 start_codon:yes stop_codon:yes gene_type:complete
MKYSKIIRVSRTQFRNDDATLRNRLNKFRGYSLDKAIHFYRMWFYLVRLSYELETDKIKFGVNNKLSVKLNKKFYKDWEIDKYLNSSFDDWFENKIHLFAEEQASLVKEGAKSDDYLYIKFNRRQRKTDIVRQVRNLLKSERYQSQAKYQIKNQYKYFYLHQQYNVLIMRIEGKSAVEIADFIEGTYGKYSERYSTSYSSLRRLFRASERLIINVAKGEF